MISTRKPLQARPKTVRQVLDLGTDPNWLRQIAKDKKHSDFEFVGVNKELKRQQTSRRLSLRRGDAIKYLQAVPDHSLDVINADFFVNNLKGVNQPEAIKYLDLLKKRGQTHFVLRSIFGGTPDLEINQAIDFVANSNSKLGQIIRERIAEKLFFDLVRKKLKPKGVFLMTTFSIERINIIPFLQDAGFKTIIHEITISEAYKGNYSEWIKKYLKNITSNPNNAPILIVAQPE